ncbi:DUF6745 domain-containing protein [Nocardia acidivorans]|uniref:DUF6745 domain-containing protein n=1 Tax=Nocardia acidivorans TaxID=404580 RepID=UPI0012F72B56|nr:hypothetical protein [Nocardia acidivorans]
MEYACRLRDDWLRVGLSTEPADRDAAEHAVTALYRLAGASAPEFVWAPSPAAAVALLRDGPHGPPGFVYPPTNIPFRSWPFSQRLSGAKYSMRTRLTALTGYESESWNSRSKITDEDWAAKTPLELLTAGATVRRIVDFIVHRPLRKSLRDNLYHPMRAEFLGSDDRRPEALGYEQYDTWTVAFHELCRTAGFAEYRPDDAYHLEQWVRLARGAGWWWPGQRRCVMSERPTVLRTVPVPHAGHGEVRLHCPDGPAAEFADGATVFAQATAHRPPSRKSGAGH